MINIEGILLPNTPLTDVQLIDAVKYLKIKNFRGVFLRDLLPSRPRKSNECGILNLDDSDGPGTHWVAWSKRKPAATIYFDSYGLPPPKEIVDYLGPIYYNTESLQPTGQVFCGHLCLYLLKKLSDGNDFQEIINFLT